MLPMNSKGIQCVTKILPMYAKTLQFQLDLFIDGFSLANVSDIAIANHLHEIHDQDNNYNV